MEIQPSGRVRFRVYNGEAEASGSTQDGNGINSSGTGNGHLDHTPLANSIDQGLISGASNLPHTAYEIATTTTASLSLSAPVNGNHIGAASFLNDPWMIENMVHNYGFFFKATVIPGGDNPAAGDADQSRLLKLEIVHNLNEVNRTLNTPLITSTSKTPEDARSFYGFCALANDPAPHRDALPQCDFIVEHLLSHHGTENRLKLIGVDNAPRYPMQESVDLVFTKMSSQKLNRAIVAALRTQCIPVAFSTTSKLWCREIHVGQKEFENKVKTNGVPEIDLELPETGSLSKNEVHNLIRTNGDETVRFTVPIIHPTTQSQIDVTVHFLSFSDTELSNFGIIGTAREPGYILVAELAEHELSTETDSTLDILHAGIAKRIGLQYDIGHTPATSDVALMRYNPKIILGDSLDRTETKPSLDRRTDYVATDELPVTIPTLTKPTSPITHIKASFTAEEIAAFKSEHLHEENNGIPTMPTVTITTDPSTGYGFPLFLDSDYKCEGKRITFEVNVMAQVHLAGHGVKSRYLGLCITPTLGNPLPEGANLPLPPEIPSDSAGLDLVDITEDDRTRSSMTAEEARNARVIKERRRARLDAKIEDFVRKTKKIVAIELNEKLQPLGYEIDDRVISDMFMWMNVEKMMHRRDGIDYVGVVDKANETRSPQRLVPQDNLVKRMPNFEAHVARCNHLRYPFTPIKVSPGFLVYEEICRLLIATSDKALAVRKLLDKNGFGSMRDPNRAYHGELPTRFFVDATESQFRKDDIHPIQIKAHNLLNTDSHDVSRTGRYTKCKELRELDESLAILGMLGKEFLQIYGPTLYKPNPNDKETDLIPEFITTEGSKLAAERLGDLIFGNHKYQVISGQRRFNLPDNPKDIHTYGIVSHLTDQLASLEHPWYRSRNLLHPSNSRKAYDAVKHAETVLFIGRMLRPGEDIPDPMLIGLIRGKLLSNNALFFGLFESESYQAEIERIHYTAQEILANPNTKNTLRDYLWVDPSTII